MRLCADGMKFLSALRRGVSAFDRPGEICSAVPFFHYRTTDQKCKSEVLSREVVGKVTYQTTGFKWQTNALTSSLHRRFHILICDMITAAFQKSPLGWRSVWVLSVSPRPLFRWPHLRVKYGRNPWSSEQWPHPKASDWLMDICITAFSEEVMNWLDV